MGAGTPWQKLGARGELWWGWSCVGCVCGGKGGRQLSPDILLSRQASPTFQRACPSALSPHRAAPDLSQELA